MEGKFEYEILVEKKPVWHGLNPKKKFEDIKKQNPGKRVSIAWKTKEDILVCQL